MSEAMQKRINDVRNMATDDVHTLFISPKQRIMMLLDYLENGGDLKAMAGKIHRKKGEKKSKKVSHSAKKPPTKKVTPSKPKA